MFLLKKLFKGFQVNFKLLEELNVGRSSEHFTNVSYATIVCCDV